MDLVSAALSPHARTGMPAMGKYLRCLRDQLTHTGGLRYG